MASVTGTTNNDTISVGSASEGVAPETGATDSDDLINGLAGDDILDGGAGNDTFVLGSGDGADSVENFVQGEDKIDLSGQDVSFEELTIEDVDEDGVAGKKVTVNEDSVTLSGFTGTLAADDFVALNESIDGARVTGTANDDVIVAGFASEGVVNAPDDASGTTTDADSVTGEGGNDTVVAAAGDDTVDGGDGNDALLGDVGNDDLAGAEGDDSLIGGDGDDILAGGAGSDEATGGAGVDRFVYDPSDSEEGADTVSDFAVGEDLISIAASDILNASPALPELSPEALDDSEDWSIAGSEGAGNGDTGEDTVDGDDGENGEQADDGGDVVISHPGGTIALDGVAFGDTTDTFVDLAAAGALEVADLVVGTDDPENLVGTDNDDVIDALAGADTLTGGSGDDILSGGADGDDFVFDPSNPNEGSDSVLDFTFQVVTDTSQRDYIALNSAEVLAADPDLPAANNDDPDNPNDDETLLTLEDFDASENWSLGASEDGWLSIAHPGGSIELVGIVPSAEASFSDLAPSIKVDGELFPEDGIALNGETNGGETDGGETDGGETDGGETDGGETDGDDADGGDTGGGETVGDDSETAPGGAAAAGLIARDAVDEVTDNEDNGAPDDDDSDTDQPEVEADGPQIVGTDGNDVIVTGFASEGVVNTPDDASGTTNEADNVTGEGGNDTVSAGGGDDTVDGGAGNDALIGDAGNDDLAGAEGDDTLIGGDGDDTLAGGAGADEATGGAGIDRFVFDPSDAAEGDDTVADFTVGEDLVSLRAADILKASPDLSELSPEALDRSDDWSIAGSEEGDNGEDTADGENGDDSDQPDEAGDVVITHPGGTITLEGVAFDDGTDTFVELAAAGALEIAGLVVGTEVGEDLAGTDDDDVIDALAGDDTLTGGSGDDILNGGAGSDDFAFDPSNEDEGADSILDFTFQVVTDTAQRDYIALNSTDVLAADPDLPAANIGDPDNPNDDANLLTLDDFDASQNWSLGASENGWLSITHPSGSIEMVGILPGADASFNDLAPVIKVDGELFPEDGIALNGGTPGQPTDPDAPETPTDPAAGEESDAILI